MFKNQELFDLQVPQNKKKRKEIYLDISIVT